MSSKGKQKKRKIKSEGKKCLFCSDAERDVLKFGRMYKLDDIYVHYYCLLLSSGLVQRGKDDEGIFGFLQNDIIKEFNRGEKLKCSYCKSTGATIGCSVKTCKVMFHLRCGQRNNASNQFYKNFDSFCVKHRPRQTLDSSHEINDSCPTCFSNVEFDEGIEVLVTPCCHKLFHRTCLQKQALSAGYFFKCATCNNSKKFIEMMNEFGVYVPKQDASWERETNAYGELYERHSRCDQKHCLCPQSREFRDHSDWQLLICDTCGSNGTHWKCIGRSDYIDVWICDQCQTVEHRIDKRSEDPNDIHSDEESDNDIEIISVESTSGSREENKVSTIKLSDHSNQLFEINVFDETQNNRIKRLKRPEMKDVAIQCTLVDVKDLIDSEPIDHLSPDVFRNATITLNDIKESVENEVINIDDSDDEIFILD